MSSLAKQNKTGRFILAHVGHDGEDCLIWPYGTDSLGYGRASIPGFSSRLAHRIMCELSHGAPASPDAVARHLCGNGHLGCVNPRHLRWGTVADNNRDKCEAGNQPFGSQIPRSKLNAEKVRAIRRLQAKGLSQRSISEEIGVHHTTVQAVIEGRTWGHVA